MSAISPQVLPVLMLFASNVFMTFAWLLRGRRKNSARWIFVEWRQALFATCSRRDQQCRRQQDRHGQYSGDKYHRCFHHCPIAMLIVAR
jgi:hypothetical protein